MVMKNSVSILLNGSIQKHFRNAVTAHIPSKQKTVRTSYTNYKLLIMNLRYVKCYYNFYLVCLFVCDV
jgi:hypothetical protein